MLKKLCVIACLMLCPLPLSAEARSFKSVHYTLTPNNYDYAYYKQTPFSVENFSSRSDNTSRFTCVEPAPLGDEAYTAPGLWEGACKKISVSFYLQPVTDVGCSPAPTTVTAYSALSEQACKGTLKTSSMQDIIDCCGKFTGKFWVGEYLFDSACIKNVTYDNKEGYHKEVEQAFSALLPDTAYAHIEFIRDADFKKPTASVWQRLNALQTSQHRFATINKEKYFTEDFIPEGDPANFQWKDGMLEERYYNNNPVRTDLEKRIKQASCTLYEDPLIAVLRCPQTLSDEEKKTYGDSGSEFVQYYKKFCKKENDEQRDCREEEKATEWKIFYATVQWPRRGEYDNRSGYQHPILRYITKEPEDSESETWYLMADGTSFSNTAASLAANTAGDFEMFSQPEARDYGECDCEPLICKPR
jgi:hypothetical protein